MTAQEKLYRCAKVHPPSVGPSVAACVLALLNVLTHALANKLVHAHDGYDCKKYSESAGQAVGASHLRCRSRNGRLAILGRSTVAFA